MYVRSSSEQIPQTNHLFPGVVGHIVSPDRNKTYPSAKIGALATISVSAGEPTLSCRQKPYWRNIAIIPSNPHGNMHVTYPGKHNTCKNMSRMNKFHGAKGPDRLF